MNVAKVREILKVIKEEPKRLRMSNWILRPDMVTENPNYSCAVIDNAFVFATKLDAGWDDLVSPIPPCNTVACFAGWTVIHFDGVEAARNNHHNIQHRGAELLELDSMESEELFYVTNWAPGIREEYVNAKTQEQRVEALEKEVNRMVTRYEERRAYVEQNQ